MRISDWSSDVCSSDLLRSISAYRDSLSYNSVDLDATPADVIAFTPIYRQKQYSEELQLSGNTGNLDWIVGAFYFKESGTEQSDNFTLINSVAGDLAPPSRSLADSKATSQALFAKEKIVRTSGRESVCQYV